MADPVISEIKYLGSGALDMLEVRIPDDYPDPENLRLVIYDRTHNGSTSQSPSASDIHNVTADGLLYTEDTNSDGQDDDGILHYTFGQSENGTSILLHAQDAVGLYNAVTGETYGLYSWSSSPYTVSTATGDPFAGQVAQQLDPSGQINGVSSLERQPDGTYTLQTSPDPGNSYICFTPNTAILTPSGDRPIESLQVGDVVVTKDFGPLPIRWIGTRNVCLVPSADPATQPVTIRAHAFGPDIPRRDTTFSPNHAVLNTDWKASLYFGKDEVLTPSKSLLMSDKAHIRRVSSVTYVHILLDRHSLICANGLWAESLYLGAQCMDVLSPDNRSAINASLPRFDSGLGNYGPRARVQLRVKDACLLA